jgi:2-dehydropantoate 2-reductase
VTIVGAGAIGGLIGAHLARAGHAILLVDRDREHVDAIRRRGLEIAGAAAFTVPVAACLPDETRGPIQTLILAVKTLHTRAALAPLVPLLAPDAVVVSMQNGLEEGQIAALVGAGRTIGAFLTFGGYYDRPGRIVYSGPGSLRIGELDGRITARVRALARALSDFHPCEATGNIQGYRWGKLILGTVYFATATVDADVVDILARAEARRALAALVGEARAVADALRIEVEPVDGFHPAAVRAAEGDPGEQGGHGGADPWAAQLAYWRRGLARRTGVWRDLAVRRRKTEAEPILGALIEAAERTGTPVPRVRALLRIIRDLEEGRGQMRWENLAEIAGAGG